MGKFKIFHDIINDFSKHKLEVIQTCKGPHSHSWKVTLMSSKWRIQIQGLLLMVFTRNLVAWSYTPQHNDEAERKNKTVVKMAQTMLKGMILSNDY
jgi:hypothetical protein